MSNRSWKNDPWTEQEIITFLKRKDKTGVKFTIRALQALYRRQEPDEQAARTSLWSNGIGFNAYDAPVIANIIWWLNNRRVISSAQLEKLREVLPRYRRQLTEIANGGKKPKEFRFPKKQSDQTELGLQMEER